MLTPETLPTVQRALADAGVDGWLLYDFRGLNPIAGGLLRLEGMTTRRAFAFVPTRGTPVAMMHAIEQGPWRHWPREWSSEIYASWRSLESLLTRHLSGKRVAMEYSAGDAVPYLDRVPAGVIEMVREAGATVASSGELVTRFYATWNAEHIASHERAAEEIATIARDAMTTVGERARGAEPLAEHELMSWIRDRFRRAGLTTDHGPNVSAGANAANPHYEPSAESPRVIRPGDIVLIDLWAREDPDGVWADQTWMASIGKPSAESSAIWNAVRDARDAAIALVRAKATAGEPLRGADVDDAARGVIEERGYGEYFTHRTGHSIDSRDLHGSGPHLDNLETREERLLVPGVAFSIEPGIYIPGQIGMRSEVNVYLTPGEAVVTPREYQHDLLIV
jgi:Xaa-Pro aminopeptidase